MKAEYLLFNLIVFLMPVIGLSFYPKRVWPDLKASIVAISVIGLAFVIWDHLVTDHWWSFNAQYVLGPRMGNLPFEEVLFFMVVPWSCLVLWENVQPFIKGDVRLHIELWLSLLLLPIVLWSGIQRLEYTISVSVLSLILVLSSGFLGHWLRKKKFIAFLGMVAILTLLFNGYLTDRPVVLYESATMSNFRIGSVPLEDFLYGLILVGGVTVLYESLKKRFIQA